MPALRALFYTIKLLTNGSKCVECERKNFVYINIHFFGIVL